MARRGRPKLPPIGSLVKLKSFSEKVHSVKVERVDAEKWADLGVSTFEVGTIGIVVGSVLNPHHEEAVPVILVRDFTGWVYNDEWEYARDEA